MLRIVHLENDDAVSELIRKTLANEGLDGDITRVVTQKPNSVQSSRIANST